jgi:hypothetical protein
MLFSLRYEGASHPSFCIGVTENPLPRALRTPLPGASANPINLAGTLFVVKEKKNAPTVSSKRRDFLGRQG